MARYKYIDTSPRFLPIDLALLLLGTFEHARSPDRGGLRGRSAFGE
jgi:hypothetical protein